MPAPDPYPAPSQTAPADEEMATNDVDTENDMGDAGEAEESPEPEEGGMGLKNHLYLPGDFPGEKKPKPGDTKEFMVKAEFVEMKDGEQCWKEQTVDGVPITSEAADEEDESAGEDESEGEEEAQGDDQSQTPQTAGQGTSNAFTDIVMGKGK